jgi:hypothetical protein
VLELQLLRVVDPDPLLSSFMTTLWPALEECADVDRTQDVYKVRFVSAHFAADIPPCMSKTLIF